MTLEEFDKLYGKKGKVEPSTSVAMSTADTEFNDMFESDTRKGEKLKKDDLYRRDRLNKIREYMISKKGADYMDADKETVVEDFVDSMRRFNTNIVATAGEARFISKADDKTKNVAKEAYELYDSLGNVFVNDGLFGAVDGVKDYILSIASDPTNYIGLATGGLGKASALGVGEASKKAIQASVAAAARRASASGATKEAAKKAGEEAADAMTAKLAGSSYTKASMKRASNAAAKKARAKVRLQAAQRAIREETGELKGKAAKKAVIQTTAIDALLSGVQDVATQDIYHDIGAQDKFSAAQTAMSLALGGIGGGLHYTFGKFDGMSGLSEAMDNAKAASRAEEFPLKRFKAEKEALRKLKKAKAPKAQIKKQQTLVNKLAREAVAAPILKQKSIKQAADQMKKDIRDWNTKVQTGKATFEGSDGNQIMPESLLSKIMLGYTPDGKEALGIKGPVEVGGLAKIFKDNGIKFSKTTKVSDIMTNLLHYMDPDDLKDISQLFRKHTNIELGTLHSLPVELGDVIAATVSGAGSTLSVMASVRRAVDGGVVSGNELLVETINSKEVQDKLAEEFGKKRKKAQYGAYMQNIWKRLLVSSPATTAANVAGFAQFYGGQGVADLFSTGMLGVAGVASATKGDKNLSKELFRQARVYKDLQAQKMKNFLDPMSTYESFMDLMTTIDNNKQVKGLLFETIGGGIERTAKRYNMDIDSPLLEKTEIFADAAMMITGVRVQDVFTKSQMFMTELDKYIRLKHGKDNPNITLASVLESGDMAKIDDDVIGGAVDTTLRSVFSKDYTTDDQMLGFAAKFVEQASNTPLLGTVIPFGRFMNNVVATAYQWGPASLLPAASRIYKASGKDIKANEAMARSMVGTTALVMAMQMDDERQKKGLAVNEIEMSGTIVDVRNVFPFSLFLAIGRAANLRRKGESVPPELREEVLNQLAIGQVARDAQFGNDLFNVFDYFTGDGSDRGKTLDALYKSLGNIAAGATRPLDAVNRSVGYLAGNDIAKDVRQAEGVNKFTQSASKYFDNILEVLIGESEALTGENLRVATREGDIYDANPLARILGLNIKRGKTATEKAYTLSELQTWKADQRSQIPMYDRIFNETLAPVLERRMTRLLKSKNFREGDLAHKRGRVKEELKRARKHVRDNFKIATSEGFLEQKRYDASNKGTKEQQKKALRMMKERGVDAELKDFNYRELQTYESIINHLNLKIKTGL
tara:strand:- start:3642 stop:7289 length:3648 start_codon:yes stop_codon:yes gene_type:complete